MGTTKRVLLAAAGAVLLLVGVPHVAAAAVGPAYYLSLGDSAAAGFQPPGVTQLGYADQLALRLRHHYPGLHLVKLGCPGETTRTLLRGTGSPCEYAAGSQLNAALQVLRAHPNEIALITINVGVNDILDRCLDETLAIDTTCAARELPAALTNLATIVRTLRHAAPNVALVGMTYWDPFLGLWVTGPDGQQLARHDHASMRALNTGLTSTYRQGGALVADAAGAAHFDIDNFDYQVLTRWGQIPRNVANSCRWTWFCAPGPLGPDPHPNTIGYGVVADAFAAVIDA